jgi:hypothetical protein
MAELDIPDFERVRDKILKINELATRGVDGEREAAIKMLEGILKKYNLVIEDIIKPEGQVKRYRFKWANVQQAYLLQQMLGHICGVHKYWHFGGKTIVNDDGSKTVIPGNKYYEAELTEFQFVDLSEIYKYYNEFLQKEYNRLSDLISAARDCIRICQRRAFGGGTVGHFQGQWQSDYEESLGELLGIRKNLWLLITHKYELYVKKDTTNQKEKRMPTEKEMLESLKLSQQMRHMTDMPRHTILRKDRLLNAGS